MKEKKLPLCESPIKVYSNYAYVLSVLFNNSEAKNWFYSNFIQVKYIRDTEKEHLFIFNYSLGNLTKYFYNIPYLEVRSVKRSFLLEICIDIIEFLWKAIEDGYYIMTIVDEYYLPPRSVYLVEHKLHLIMLNGFNLEKECFYSMGYNGSNYEETALKFEDVFKAISSEEGNNINIRDDFCMLYRLQDKDKIEYLQENFNYFEIVQKRLQLHICDCIYIGNHISDYLMSKQAGVKFYAFNSDDSLTYYIKRDTIPSLYAFKDILTLEEFGVSEKC